MKRFSKLFGFIVVFIAVMVSFCTVSFAEDPNTWVEKAPMSIGRAYHQVVTLNGKIYVLGGINQSTTLNSVEEYDPETNKWTAKASMLNGRKSFQVAVINNKIYAIGGYNSASGSLNTVEEYDPLTNIWKMKAPMAIKRYSHKVAVVGIRYML